MGISAKLAALSLAAALLLTGCGASITGVTLSLPDTMERGTTAAATPEYAWSGATPEQARADSALEKLGMNWTSSDPSVVMVDADGNLAAVNAGTAEVALTSADGTIRDSDVITVVVSPTGISMADALELQLGANTTAQLQAEITPADATCGAVQYSSSDEAVATVAQDGTVTAVSAGEADITAELPDTGLAVRCHLTVLPEEPAEEAPAQEETAPQSGQTQAEQPADSADTVADTPAPAASTAYGAVPFSAAAGSQTWWGIDSTDSAFSAVLENINAYRAAVGVAPLSVDSGLTAIADQRCGEMVVAGVMSHDGYQTAEIIAQNYNSAQSVVDAWANSPGHYAAMTSPDYTVCGIGCWFEEGGATYWCVTFG